MVVKKKIITIIFIIVTCIFIPNVNAEELCTPTKEYEEYQKLSDEEKAKYQEPVYCSEITENTQEKKTVFFPNFNPVSKAITDTKYNSYTEGYVSAPKNQYYTGLCWDFSAISAVESNANLKGLGSMDLSESHLAYSLISGLYNDAAGRRGKYLTQTSVGGKITYAPSYFYGGYGQLTESELKFEDTLTYSKNNLKSIYSSNYPKGRNIVNLDNFYLDNYTSTGSCTNSDINNIKYDILTYGSVQATMYMDEDLFEDPNQDYYISHKNDTAKYSNHGIVIVGWDDTISKSKFKNATRDGAWIIKNSWGKTWSEDGFFYISYDDEFICNLVANYEVSEENASYKYTYKSSDVIGIPEISMTNTYYLATKFTKKSIGDDTKELLKKVSYSIGSNMFYTVYLSKDNDLSDESKWIELTNGFSSVYGIKSSKFDNITIEDDFTIILKYQIESGKTSSAFVTCNNIDETSQLDYPAGVNSLSRNGKDWYDMNNITFSSELVKCQPNMYAYTVDASTLKIEKTDQNESKINFKLSSEYVDETKIEYDILDDSNNSVLDHFTIKTDYSTNEIIVESDNTVSGTFNLVVKYNNISAITNFELVESVTVDNINTKIDSNIMYVLINNKEQFTYQNLINRVSLKNTLMKATDKVGNEITNQDTVLGTATTIKTNNHNYKLVVVGDVNNDGKINSADLLKIVKHLKGTITLDNIQLLAADCRYDEKINSADLLKIVKYLKGTGTLNIKG